MDTNSRKLRKPYGRPVLAKGPKLSDVTADGPISGGSS